MKIAAFDLATNTGVAIGCPGHPPHLSSEVFGDPGDPQPARFAQAFHYARILIKRESPDLIVIEKPVATGVKGKEQRIFLLAGLRGTIMAAARLSGVPVAEYPVGTVRKHFLGTAKLKRDAAKLATLEECRRRGWAPANDNEADAAALLDLAFGKRNLMVSPGGLFDRKGT